MFKPSTISFVSFSFCIPQKIIHSTIKKLEHVQLAKKHQQLNEEYDQQIIIYEVIVMF